MYVIKRNAASILKQKEIIITNYKSLTRRLQKMDFLYKNAVFHPNINAFHFGLLYKILWKGIREIRLNLFWSIKNSGEILDKLKARDFNATSLSTYDFSTLYTTLPHNLIIYKLIDLIERTFQREGSPYLACNDRNAFFTSEKT